MESLDNTRIIPLEDGQCLTIEYNEAFYAKVRKYFELANDVDPSDDHIKEFFITFMSAAS